MLLGRRARGLVLTGALLIIVSYYYFHLLESHSQSNQNNFEASPRPTWNGKPDDIVTPAASLPQKSWTHTVQESTPLRKPTPVPSTSTTLTTSGASTTRALLSLPTRTAEENDVKTPKVSTSDVLLIFKTGASTIWKRMPLHLTTTLSNGRFPNIVVYSDLEEPLSSNILSVDVLANVSEVIKSYDRPAYDSYQELRNPQGINTYREYSLLPGDESTAVLPGSPPGWRLDRYKFIPMLTHAQQNWPDLKWYIYIEDDSFLFIDNLLDYLSDLSPDAAPAYYGAYSGDGNDTFAQGGSGIVFSRSLMRSVFGGKKVPTLEEYGNYTSNSCCGDIVLGKVLRDHGIFVNERTYGTASLRPEPPWRTGFDTSMWCEKVFSFHHLHQRDLVELDLFDKTAKRPAIFRDVYERFIAQHIGVGERTGWDNFATKYEVTSNTTTVPLALSVESDRPALQAAFETPKACKGACHALKDCLGWRHDSAKKICRLDAVAKLGRETSPQPKWEEKTIITSGWMVERIEERLIGDRCDGKGS
ncbi:hypothetical protein BGZ60DRAFT_411241 [Tricladium varicosporioides]|nr:hypothetical protein BGZ60DRAFT_411241 [Hymenoscyphus varicosporioides]